jgi:hypothetical protein
MRNPSEEHKGEHMPMVHADFIACLACTHLLTACSTCRAAAVDARCGGLFKAVQRSKRVLCAVAACTPPEQPLVDIVQCYEALLASKGDVQQALLSLVPAGQSFLLLCLKGALL